MSPTLQLRISTSVIATLLAIVCIGNLVAQLLQSPVSQIAVRNTVAALASAPRSNGLLAASVAPLRADIQSDKALILTNLALSSSGSAAVEARNSAERELRRVLAAGPGNSKLWTALAALTARTDPDAPAMAELLKLSYYTGPRELETLPLRLELAASATALRDPELHELAKGDVTALLSSIFEDGPRQLSGIYDRSSATGRTFIDNALQTIKPSALDGVRRTAR